MNRQIEPQDLKGFTATHSNVAIAVGVRHLTCVVYAGGEECGPWTDAYLPSELDSYRLGGPITSTGSDTDYWILDWNGARAFRVAEGPMDSSSLIERIGSAASK